MSPPGVCAPQVPEWLDLLEQAAVGGTKLVGAAFVVAAAVADDAVAADADFVDAAVQHLAQMLDCSTRLPESPPDAGCSQHPPVSQKLGKRTAALFGLAVQMVVVLGGLGLGQCCLHLRLAQTGFLPLHLQPQTGFALRAGLFGHGCCCACSSQSQLGRNCSRCLGRRSLRKSSRITKPERVLVLRVGHQCSHSPWHVGLPVDFVAKPSVVRQLQPLLHVQKQQLRPRVGS